MEEPKAGKKIRYYFKIKTNGYTRFKDCNIILGSGALSGLKLDLGLLEKLRGPILIPFLTLRGTLTFT